MTDPPPQNSNSRADNEIKTTKNKNGGEKVTLNHHHRINPAESSIPDAATLRDQWRFAVRQYSRWYSQAWGSAILAGVSFFALGWFIKGENPLPSFNNPNPPTKLADDDDDDWGSHRKNYHPWILRGCSPFDAAT